MFAATKDFFESVPDQARHILTCSTRGSLQINLSEDGAVEHWHVTIAPGKATVAREACPADAVWESTAIFFDGLVKGGYEVIAAVWRNEVSFRGDLRLLLALRRFLPSPPGTRDPRETAREQHREALRKWSGAARERNGAAR